MIVTISQKFNMVILKVVTTEEPGWTGQPGIHRRARAGQLGISA